MNERMQDGYEDQLAIADDKIQRLIEGMKEAIKLIEYWYKAPQDNLTWETYYKHSPEMKRLRKLSEY